MSAYQEYIDAIKHCELIPRVGKVVQFYGLVVEANGPDAFLGEICEIYASPAAQSVLAEVVGFRNGHVLLMPYGSLKGIFVGSEIIATGRSAFIRVGDHLKGRIVNAFGEPLDDKPLEHTGNNYPLYPDTVNPLHRQKISEVFETGVKSIDCFLTVGKGQRMGLFAGSGVGKSTLLGMLARNTKADINVIALIGERGREVIDFVEDNLGEEGLKNSVLVVATSDQDALIRTHAAYAATAIAEYFMNQGHDVLLAMDSITRFAMAQREIGLAIGEPPTAKGYTPSTFATLPKLMERCGNFEGKGSITAFYTILVEGDDINDPIADHTRAILDGHVHLSREIANQGRYPAVDLLSSNSRMKIKLITEQQQQIINTGMRIQSVYQQSKDMIEMGMYEHGSNKDIDEAIAKRNQLEDFISQSNLSCVDHSEAMNQLKAILR